MSSLSAKAINEQKTLSVWLPIETTFTLQKDNISYDCIVQSIELFPTRYTIVTKNEDTRSVFTDYDLYNYRKSISNVRIPDFYCYKSSHRFYFIPADYIQDVKTYLSNVSYSIVTPISTPNRRAVYCLSAYEENDEIYENIIQFDNGIIAIPFWVYENVSIFVQNKLRKRLFRERFQELITANNVNLNLLPKQANLSQSWFTQLNNGKQVAGEKTIRKLSAYFGISYEYLAGYTDDIKQNRFSAQDNHDSIVVCQSQETYHLTENENELLAIFKRLPKHDQDAILDYAHYRANKNN